MTGPELLAAGERAETAGDYLAAAAAYRRVAEQPDVVLAAEAWFCLGRVSWRQVRFDAAVSAFESARALASQENAEALHARVQNGMGAVHYARGDFAAARQSYADASARTSDDTMRGKIILNLGVIENIEGNLDAALEHYERAYVLFQATGDDESAMLALHNRGMVEADLGRWDAADASFLDALARATTRGNVEMIAKTLVNRSEVLLQRGALQEAIEHCDRALRTYSDIGDEAGRGEALRWRARALARDGETVLAERNASEALQLAMRAGARLLEAETARDLGELRTLLGDQAGARKLLERAEALFVELGARREAAEVAARLRGNS
jgi:tetratricopeptide (TPR) repeat protein